ncbi:MAG: GIY-YIG nuclease family protein [Sphingobium sp.]|nr:GIY-YIG nuclease family protein [Sphingobium sp.]MCI1271055.1 GIY-YIG nuclease family protein [Sphingobium sp.]MCI1755689.1 GIY-YIG nuclease family protein [Sphingobium sp.]MCI2052587.1 GIY-YIG nuclease family protein [Sphingobium sp.]
MLTALQALLDGAIRVERETADDAISAPGAYALILTFCRPLAFTHKGAVHQLTPGAYIYAGSAYGPGGLRARLRRHFRAEKRPHWHIDALTVAADRLSALALERGRECAIISRLMDSGAFQAPIPGFGSSDCALCTSHLLRLNQ